MNLKHEIQDNHKISDYLKFHQIMEREILPKLQESNIRNLMFYDKDGAIIYELMINSDENKSVFHQYLMYIWGRKHELHFMNKHVLLTIDKAEKGLSNIIKINDVLFNVIYTPSSIGTVSGGSTAKPLLVQYTGAKTSTSFNYDHFTVYLQTNNGICNINIKDNNTGTQSNVAYSQNNYNTAYQYNSTTTTSLSSNMRNIKDPLFLTIQNYYTDDNSRGTFFYTIWNYICISN